MSFDLGDLHLITDRPGATPAPTVGPGDPPIPTGPWAPRFVEKPCGCGVLAGESCDCEAFAAELATAPVIRFEPRRAAA